MHGQDYYAVTNAGHHLIHYGAGDKTSVNDFAMWMVVWVGVQATYQFDTRDLVDHADNTLYRHPNQTDRTLKAARHLKDNVQHILTQVLAKGWIVRANTLFY